jgi:hypothetical protein
MKKEIPAPVFAVVLAAAVAVLVFFLYRGATGGVQGDGRTHNVEASPPIGGIGKQGLKDIYKH